MTSQATGDRSGEPHLASAPAGAGQAVVAPRLEHAYRVRFDEAGADGHMRSSGYLRWAQDMAWRHSESAGFGREWYAEQRLTWLIRAVDLDVVAEVEYGRELLVSTEVVGFRRVWARRRSEFSDADGGRVHATALTDWVLLNERGLPSRVPESIAALFVSQPGTFTPLRIELAPTPRSASWREFAVRASELDPMNHVNNAAYLDYVDEHLLAVGRTGEARRVPRRYRVEFIQPAEAGAQLVGRGWDDELGWCYRLADSAGRELLRARLETDPAGTPSARR